MVNHNLSPHGTLATLLGEKGVRLYFAVLLFLSLVKEVHTKVGGLLIRSFDNQKTLPSTLSMLMTQDLIFLPSLHKPINRLISGLLLL